MLGGEIHVCDGQSAEVPQQEVQVAADGKGCSVGLHSHVARKAYPHLFPKQVAEDDAKAEREAKK